MRSHELKQWLRNNSSGVYRPAREAADYIDRLEAALRFIRDECDWEEPRGDFGGGGDARIGTAIDSALANEPDEPQARSKPTT